MANGGTPPAGWQQDPTGRNELRYWDGTAWTDNASTAGKALTDPVDGPSGSVATGGAATAMKFRTDRDHGRAERNSAERATQGVPTLPGRKPDRGKGVIRRQLPVLLRLGRPVEQGAVF